MKKLNHPSLTLTEQEKIIKQNFLFYLAQGYNLDRKNGKLIINCINPQISIIL